MLNEKTFGSSPASMYLVRELNHLNHKPLIRACTVRIKSFHESLRDIEASVINGNMKPKTAANLFRLLREDAVKISIPEEEFISQLLRNTIIGNIKRDIRRISIIRKIENVNCSHDKLINKSVAVNLPGRTRFDVLGYTAGYILTCGEYFENTPQFNEIKDTVTPEILHCRSDARCERLNKPHTIKQ